MNLQKYKETGWLVLLLITILAVITVFIPIWFIQPFKSQNSQMLAWSFILKRWSPILTIIITGLSLLISIILWRATSRYLPRIALILIIAILCGTTWLARQNHFEWMFAQIKKPAYCRSNEATFLNEQDMVLAIANNQEAVAYPIRQMAYHHVLSDIVGGKPIVVTY